jgi:hypothetical protein
MALAHWTGGLHEACKPGDVVHTSPVSASTTASPLNAFSTLNRPDFFTVSQSGGFAIAAVAVASPTAVTATATYQRMIVSS